MLQNAAIRNVAFGGWQRHGGARPAVQRRTRAIRPAAHRVKGLPTASSATATVAPAAAPAAEHPLWLQSADLRLPRVRRSPKLQAVAGARPERPGLAVRAPPPSLPQRAAVPGVPQRRRPAAGQASGTGAQGSRPAQQKPDRPRERTGGRGR